MKKLILVLFFLFISSYLIYFNFIISSDKKSQNKKIDKLKTIENEIKVSIPEIKLDPNSADLNIYFDYKIEKISNDQRILNIYLKGNEKLLADAIDLKLLFNESIKVEKIIDGNSFDFYPRKVIENNYVLITGVGLNDKNELKFAKPGTIFTKFLIKINNKDKLPILILDKHESKIFIQGKEITDINNSFKEIKLN